MVEPARPGGLRERKKRATRQLISNVATQLFAARGFDDVTMDDVATAANVSKMTVFNYFARKEDLLFDRTDEMEQLVRDVRDRLANRGNRAPIATLHALAHELAEQRHRFVKMTPAVAAFWKIVADSPTLLARTRELSEELELELAWMLAGSVGAAANDPTAQLVAALLIGAWRVAFREALRRQRSARAGATRDAFLELLDRGFAAASTAARGTAYVRSAK